MKPRKFELLTWAYIADTAAMPLIAMSLIAMPLIAMVQSPRNPGANAAQPPYAADPPRVAIQIEPFTWHDADTAKGTLRQFYGLAMEEDRGIRALGYDAWEIGHLAGAGVTDAERARGQAAVAELRELSRGRTLWAEPEKRGSRDSFGRPLARFWLRDESGWIDVAQWARDRGHVRQ